MSRETDFYLTVDRASGLLLDATCAARAAVAPGLPYPHRRWMRAAIAKLEAAQDDLWKARNDPLCPPPQPKHAQLALL